MDLISRQAAIDMFQRQAYDDWNQGTGTTWANAFSEAADMIENLPSAEPTLYGYKIEHLAYIARVMQKEGITAEQAVNAFDDLGMAVRLITEEAQQKIEEAIYDYNTGTI